MATPNLNILLAQDSLAKASTPEPVGPGELWHKKDKSIHLPYYVQHIANALISAGHSESEAIQMAVGIIRRWAQGNPSGGEHHIDDNTRAAARKALAEWESVKARAKTTK